MRRMNLFKKICGVVALSMCCCVVPVSANADMELIGQEEAVVQDVGDGQVDAEQPGETEKPEESEKPENPEAEKPEALTKPITDVETTSYSDKGIQLFWSNVEGADYYNVYRADSKDGSYEKVTTAEDGEEGCVDSKDLKGDSDSRFYVVRAVVGEELGPWDKEYAVEGVTMPETPYVTRAFSHKLAVRIETHALGADGFEFGQTIVADGFDTFERIEQESSVFKRKFEDPVDEIYYDIRAYKETDLGRVYSEPADQISGFISEDKNSLINVPGDVNVTKAFTHKKAIRVEAKASQAYGYEFYIRKGGDGQKYELVQDGKKNICTFKNLKAGQKYVVKVQAYKKAFGHKMYAMDPAYVTGKASSAKKNFI